MDTDNVAVSLADGIEIILNVHQVTLVGDEAAIVLFKDDKGSMIKALYLQAGATLGSINGTSVQAVIVASLMSIDNYDLYQQLEARYFAKAAKGVAQTRR